MAHTYVLNHLHLVFSTQHRRPLIRPEWEPELHSLFAGIARNKNFTVDLSGGTDDHVHLLLRIPARIELSHAVAALKANTSRWAKDRCPDFAWQQGYAAFSISFSALDRARLYIRNQKHHHHKLSYDDELRSLLRKHAMPFDEKYLLD